MKKISILILAAATVLYYGLVKKNWQGTGRNAAGNCHRNFFPDSLVITKMLMYGSGLPSCSH